MSDQNDYSYSDSSSHESVSSHDSLNSTENNSSSSSRNCDYSEQSNLIKTANEFHQKLKKDNSETQTEEGSVKEKGFKNTDRFGEVKVEEVIFKEPDSVISEEHLLSDNIETELKNETRVSDVEEAKNIISNYSSSLKNKVEAKKEKAKTFIEEKSKQAKEVLNKKFDEETKEELKTIVDEGKQVGKAFLTLIKKVISK